MSKFIKEPTQRPIDPREANIDKAYTALGKSTEFWIILGHGAFAFRFGPYTGPEAGEILTRAVKERIATTIVGQCGRDFDWEIARDMGLRLVLPRDRWWRRLLWWRKAKEAA